MKYHVNNKGLRRKIWWDRINYDACPDTNVHYKRLRNKEIAFSNDKYGHLRKECAISVYFMDCHGKILEYPNGVYEKHRMSRDEALHVIKGAML